MLLSVSRGWVWSSGQLGLRTSWRWCSTKRDRKLMLVAFSGKRRAGKDTACDLMMDAIQTAHIAPWKSKQSIGYFPKRMYCEETGTSLQQVLKNDE